MRYQAFGIKGYDESDNRRHEKDIDKKINKRVISLISDSLRGYCTPNIELACFVCYLKIVNTFMKNIECILYSKLSKERKSSIEMKVCRAVFELLIKTMLLLF